MGEILAILHWVVGVNDTDIELVLGGGSGNPKAVSCWVTSFNQIRLNTCLMIIGV